MGWSFWKFSGATINPYLRTLCIRLSKAWFSKVREEWAIKISSIEWKINNSGNCWRVGDKAISTNFWHKVGLFFIPCESTFLWKHWYGLCKFIEGKLKAKRFLSSGCKGIVKKHLAIYNTRRASFGNLCGRGQSWLQSPLASMAAFPFLTSCNNLHLPDFFLITKIGVFQGLVEG